MSHFHRAAAAFAASLLIVTSARAALLIDVGSHTLLANTPNQNIPVRVTGGDAVFGVTFVAQVGDGGPAAGGLIVGPSISADVKTGTLFDSVPGTVFSDVATSSPQITIRTALLDLLYTVPANGLVATLSIDTTGFSAGTWALSLSSILGDATELASDQFESGYAPLVVVPGSITIQPIPEPAAMVLLLTPIAALRRRR